MDKICDGEKKWKESNFLWKFQNLLQFQPNWKNLVELQSNECNAIKNMQYFKHLSKFFCLLHFPNNFFSFQKNLVFSLDFYIQRREYSSKLSTFQMDWFLLIFDKREINIKVFGVIKDFHMTKDYVTSLPAI